MKMEMLRDNLLIKELEKEQIGKIVLPNSVPDDYIRGKVIAAGPGLVNYGGDKIELVVKVGDIVVYPPSMRGSYPIISIGGEKLIILSEQYVWAIDRQGDV